MRNRTAIVTGGAQGIGRAISRVLLENDYNVAIAEIDSDAGREAEEELRDFGPVKFIQTDVSSEPAVIYLIEETVNWSGDISVLVNNAGVFLQKKLVDLSSQDWDYIIGVNLKGPFLCSKYASPHLSLNHGSIINISSTRAMMSEPDTEAYSASKGGLVSLTHALALSLAPDVRVNCISPGWIETRDWKKWSNRMLPLHTEQEKAQHPVGRVGNPLDIANMVNFLIDPDNSFITGQNFVVDGGMTKKMIYI
ncbi:MAG TPA: SDR family oxidoreductase [Chitinispirillaceae bacterium]|jgi:NAD(P)-dependent dehydrogenase (short-subunit alcohol dehydrogenase family)|nr:SDR family oxidoreductase [Chitinispirillaceae bacterium]